MCETQDCNPRSLNQSTKDRDIPMVTLIKGQTVHQHVPVFTGKCRSCKTLYTADHERFEDTSTIQNTFKRVYINSAKYLKIGQSLWADCGFATSAINAMYNFHSSASAYSEYWNNTYGTDQISRGLIVAPQIPVGFRGFQRNTNWQRALPILLFLFFLIPAESVHSGIDTGMFPGMHRNGMPPE